MNVVLAFDLDGTLFDGKPDNYDDPAHLLEVVHAHARACERVTYLAGLGARIVYVTGRGHHVRDATEQQIQAAGLPEGTLHTQEKFTSYTVMSFYKASVLQQERALLYVGDHVADEDAARLARTRFMHANAFRDGHAIPLHVHMALARADTRTSAPPAAAAALPARDCPACGATITDPHAPCPTCAFVPARLGPCAGCAP